MLREPLKGPARATEPRPAGWRRRPPVRREQGRAVARRGRVDVIVERGIVEDPVEPTQDVLKELREQAAIGISDRVERTGVVGWEDPGLEREPGGVRGQGDESVVLRDDALARRPFTGDNVAIEARGG